MSPPIMSPSIHPKYRPDIDGLRALAILLVLAFHAFPQSLTGGFIGVDIFFVISGFLISTIIFKSLDQGSFDFKTFYVRRIRRIFPALLIVLTAVSVAGWLFLFPDELTQLGKQLYKGGIFILNFNLAQKGGYFDSDAEMKPLLHLWSLCIEEQFYIVWPILLVFFYKHARTKLFHAVCALCALSFIANIICAAIDPIKDFYFPMTRFWELSAGGILAWQNLHNSRLNTFVSKHSHALAAIGLGLIIAASALINETKTFPGWWALLPVIGAFLLIAAGPTAFINRRVLAHRIAVFIGLISYPLYLWHWPLFSFARIINDGEISIRLAWVLIVASFILAFLTYQLIEKKVRFSSKPYTTHALIILMVVLIGVGLMMRSETISSRLKNERTDKILAAVGDWNYPGAFNFNKSSDFKSYIVKGDPKKSVLIIGDSHAEQYWPRLEYMAKKSAKKPQLIFATYGGCPPLPNVNRIKPGYACDKFFTSTSKLARDKDVKTVVYIARWEGAFGLDKHVTVSSGLYRTNDSDKAPITLGTNGADIVLKDLQQEISDLHRMGKKVFIVLPNPADPAYDPTHMISRLTGNIRSTEVSKDDITKQIAPIVDRLKDIAKATKSETLDPMIMLCDKDVCPTITPDGKPIYKDGNHIRAYYVRENGKFIDRVLN